MSTLYVDNLQPNLGSRVMAAGHVVQVVQGTFGGAQVINSTSFLDFGLSAAITPTSVNSKILVTYNVHAQGHTGNEYAYLRIYRGETAVGLGDARGSRTLVTSVAGAVTSSSDTAMQMQSMSYLDSPSSTSAITYSVRCRSYDTSGSNQAYINRSLNDANGSYIGQPISTITLMEIAQ